MNRFGPKVNCTRLAAVAAILLGMAGAATGTAQRTALPALPARAIASAETAQSGQNAKPEFHIAPDQAQKLFALVDELIKFSSDETGLPIKSTVKRQLTTRADVEKYLMEKFNEDESAKRLERSEIVLKKFGLLDRDFNLKPFLLELLKEQIEAYYDSKTKTVNLLDWVDPEEQKPVMAHELTHALQDQHSDLEKWNDQTPNDISHDAAADTDHLSKDEWDTARDAVTEGQATAVMMDYILKPMDKSLVKNPEVMEAIQGQMINAEDSPVMARAPLLITESMLFPYRDGLNFEQDVWMDQGREAAFAGTLDRPPTSSWEILNPREYEHRHIPSIPLLPNIHPLVDSIYKPYDIGQIGQLDVHILTKLFGGDNADRALTPAWDGGFYWAGQLRNATAAERASTKSLGLFYLSAWKNENAANYFARIYAENLGRKYSNLKQVEKPASESIDADGSVVQEFSTSEGPVVIATRNKMVFVSEGFALPLAHRLATLILNAQGSGDVRTASAPAGNRPRIVASQSIEGKTLTSALTRFFGEAGVIKAAVEPLIQAGR